MLSKYIQYFLDENNLEIGEEFMLTNENGRHIHPDKTFFFIGDPTSTRDILISKETYAFDFEVEANNRVEAEEKAKEYVDKYQADKFFECATNRVFKIIPTIEGDKE